MEAHASKIDQESLGQDLLFEKILHGLRRDGYFHLKQAISEERFQGIAARLGEIIRTEDIRLFVTSRLLHQPQALKFHTDQPYVDLIAWRCVIPDPQGPTLLLKAAELIDGMSAGELELLSQVIVNSPNPDDLSDLHPEPLIRVEGGRLKLFYIAFRGSQKLSSEVREAFEKFNDLIHGTASRNAFGVVLGEGECLFLDNKTLFHSRPALAPTTPRFLKRLWIRSSLVPGYLVRNPFLLDLANRPGPEVRGIS